MNLNNLSLRKEWRTLFPIFGLTVLAMVLERLVLYRNVLQPFEIMTMGAGCAFMGAATFAEEFQSRTMSLLLSHPVPRQSIWYEKMTALALALVVVFGVFLVCLDFALGAIVLGFVPVCVLFTGPGIGISARNTFLGALCIFAAPFGIWLGVMSVYGLIMWLSPQTGRAIGATIDMDPYPYGIVAGTVYCIVTYRMSYRRFLRLEVIDAHAPEIQLPVQLETMLGRLVERFVPGYSGTISSLVRKELRLQKPGFLIAGVLCVAAVVEMLLWAIHQSEVLMGFLLVNPILCVVVIPMVVAGSAVAEERGMGVFSWQRSLPPSAIKQWLVKLVVVLGMCILLGAALPTLMVNVWHLVNNHALAGILIPHDAQTGLIALNVAAGYLLVISVVLFASSASTSTLRAILLGLLLVILIAFGGVWPFGDNPLATLENDLMGLTLHGTPWVMICTLLMTHIFAYRNYRRIEVTGGRTTWQSVAIMLPMVIWGLCFYGIRLILDYQVMGPEVR